MSGVSVNLQIRDDRGKLSSVTGKANTERYIFKESLRGGSIHREATRWSWANVGWLLLACALAAVAGRILLVVYPGGHSSIVGFPLLALIAYMIMRFTRYAAARQRALQQQVRRVVESGACPACDYSLRDIPPASDGWTLCPECGAAWRLESAPTS